MQKTVLITGASQGIGEAIALTLAEVGFTCILIARNRAKLALVQSKIEAKGGKAHVFSCDVSKSAEIEATLSLIKRDLGAMPLILVNNAGLGGPFHRVDQVSEQEWEEIFNTNVKSAFLFSRRLLPEMKEANFGRIINIASIYSENGGALSSTYAASKHALIGYTKSLAMEWAAYNITCNALSPGYIDSAMGASEAQANHILERIPAQRQGTVEEVAQCVKFLIQPEAAYFNGANLIMDGGMTAGFPAFE